LFKKTVFFPLGPFVWRQTRVLRSICFTTFATDLREQCGRHTVGCHTEEIAPQGGAICCVVKYVCDTRPVEDLQVDTTGNGGGVHVLKQPGVWHTIRREHK
jgi:hypothetical protein